jgi:myosin heavy subunit
LDKISEFLIFSFFWRNFFWEPSDLFLHQAKISKSVHPHFFQKQQRRAVSVGFKIRQGAGELIRNLASCSPHYVRCIKPNDSKKPSEWSEKRVEHQV